MKGHAHSRQTQETQPEYLCVRLAYQDADVMTEHLNDLARKGWRVVHVSPVVVVAYTEDGNESAWVLKRSHRS